MAPACKSRSPSPPTAVGTNSQCLRFPRRSRVAPAGAIGWHKRHYCCTACKERRVTGGAVIRDRCMQRGHRHLQLACASRERGLWQYRATSCGAARSPCPREPNVSQEFRRLARHGMDDQQFEMAKKIFMNRLIRNFFPEEQLKSLGQIKRETERATCSASFYRNENSTADETNFIYMIMPYHPVLARAGNSKQSVTRVRPF